MVHGVLLQLRGEFLDVSAATAFDSILDGEYRKIWDENLIEDYEVCRLDDCNDVGYYSSKWACHWNWAVLI